MQSFAPICAEFRAAPQVREIFAGFSIEAVGTTYSIANADPSRAGELIITPLEGVSA